MTNILTLYNTHIINMNKHNYKNFPATLLILLFILSLHSNTLYTNSSHDPVHAQKKNNFPELTAFTSTWVLFPPAC